ncbi:MAG: clan AA aspartic protease [Saprospiraceae bacterium]|nr:clan AA aspartic protease [Saprospiraceae bacterium]
MGLIYAKVVLKNGEDLIDVRRKRIEPGMVRSMNLDILVDSGAIMLAINETIKAQLGLETTGTDFAQLADGSTMELDMVGPIEVNFENRQALVEAFVLPGESEPLLGAIPMEAMDVLIDMSRQRLVVNPSHPNRPQFSMK